VLPHYTHKCPSCHVRIKCDSRWEWGSSLVLALPVIGFVVWWDFGELQGWVVWLVGAVMTVIGFIYFPYVTQFVLKNKS
jgi:hypothetical protein